MGPKPLAELLSRAGVTTFLDAYSALWSLALRVPLRTGWRSITLIHRLSEMLKLTSYEHPTSPGVESEASTWATCMPALSGSNATLMNRILLLAVT